MEIQLPNASENMEKEKNNLKGTNKSNFGGIKGFFMMLGKPFKKLFSKAKAFYQKYLEYSIHKYKAFTALQVKEVFSREKATNNVARERVLSIVFPILRFLIVFAITFVLFFLNSIFGIIQPLSLYYFFVFFTAVIIVMQLIASIASCTNSYYIAEDNKVLITFPSSGATLFLSKLTVEYIKELKSATGLYVPFTMGLIVYGSLMNKLAPFQLVSALWGLIPIVIMCAVIVLLGSLFSVLYLQYLRLVKTLPVVRLVVLGALFGGIVYLSVLVINLIPENINLIQMWNTIRAGIDGFLKEFTKYAYPIDFFCSTIVGFRGNAYKGFKLIGKSFARFALILAVSIVLFAVVFIVIKKLFLHMMTKSVDYEKVSENIHHKNNIHHQHTTFAFKELKISFRTLEISGTYVVTYVLIPVLILLLCKVFDAINTNMRGNMLSIMFILLLIVLPLLASNTPISSAYSREGHAGYIKKTKPIKPYTPMLSKLLFNLVLSIPSIFASIFIVGRFGKMDIPSLIFLGFSVLLLQYAHIFYSSTLDFTKPKNESYQTEGQGVKNPNENTATVVAFVMSFVFAGFVYFFFNECVKFKDPTFIKAAVRLFIASAVTFGSCLTLYILKLKAFFMER